MPAKNDRNLLLGILALQLDFIHRDQLIDAMHVWVMDKATPLNRVLVRQGALDAEAEPLLLAVLEKHLELHDHDVEKSLASVSSLGSLKEELASLQDPAIDATLELSSRGDSRAADSSAATVSGRKERFRILRPHARGGLGEVAVAMDQELNREVALKLIQQRYADDRNNRDRFVAEAEITGGLEHPSIVPVYGLGTHEDGRPFYAMRFIRGDSLREAAQRFHAEEFAGDDQQQLALRKLLGRFIDVCQAIEYAHSRGVLHRDLKPGNIMLGRFGETLVVDWGLAKAVGRPDSQAESEEETLLPASRSGGSGAAPTQMGSAMGTPAYMSPEQAEGRIGDIGPASDVYSLGATLFYVLTGQAPVVEDSVAAILERVKAGQVRAARQINARVPRPLDAICRKALAHSPEDRYASPLELAEDVERWLADAPVSAFREPWLDRAARWVRQHQTLVAASAVVALIAIVASLGIAWQADEARRRIAAEKQIADRAREVAQRNFGRALDSVELMLTRVGNERLANVPFMSEVRRDLLEDALAFYLDALSEQEQALPSMVLQTARSHRLLGRCYRMLGDFPAVRRHLNLQRDLLGKLQGEPSLAWQVEKNMLTLLVDSGSLFRLMGDPAAALEELNQAAVLHDALPAAVQDDPKIAATHAAIRQELAQALTETGELSAAEKESLRAGELFALLVSQRPQDADILYSLQAALHNRGLLYLRMGDPQSAEEALLQAADRQQQLLAVAGELPGYRVDQASTLMRLGNVLVEQGRFPEAEQRQASALEIYRQLNRDYPSVRHYSTQFAAANHNLAEVVLRMNRFPQAIELLQSSIERLEATRAAEPLLQKEVADLANSYMTLGQAQSMLGEPADAEGPLRKAAELWSESAQSAPDVPMYHVQVAACQHNLANILFNSGELEEAESLFRNSIQRLDQLKGDLAQVPQVKSDRGNSWMHLASSLQRMGRLEQAEQAYMTARDHFAELAQEEPDNPKYADQHAASFHNHADLLLAANRVQEAAVGFQRSIDILTPAAAKFPEVGIIQADLANSLQQKAVALNALNQAAESLSAIEASLEMWERLNLKHPQTPELLAGRAMAQTRQALFQHDLAKAATIARSFAKQIRRPEDHYSLACMFAVCLAEAMEADSREEGLTAEALRTEALQHLTTAGQQGAATAPQLMSDPDLKSLRDDPALQELAKQLGHRSEPDGEAP
ncbi:tetratricopeptide repeat protein [Planctomycetaceae bacterium SH139]